MALPAVLMGIENVISAVVFVMFIYEEAIQTLSIGCYLAIKHKDIQGFDACLIELRDHAIPNLENCWKDWGWIAPYAWPSFKAFCEASKQTLAVYEDIRANWKY